MMSVPPHGLLPSSMSMYATNPGLWTELRRSVAGSVREADLGIIERNMFLNGAPPTARRLRDLMTEPAERASRDVMGMIPFAPMPWAMPKLLVVGGTQDRFIPVSDAHLTAMYYGTRAVILDAAHAVMADVNWRVAADALADWLAECFGE